MWADAHFKQRILAVKWSLSREMFEDMVNLFGCPQIDTFMSHENHRLSPFFVLGEINTSRGPGCIFGSMEQMALSVSVSSSIHKNSPQDVLEAPFL